MTSVDDKYILKCVFKAHASDVRVLKPAPVPDGALITGSRDSLVKVWSPEGEQSYKEVHVFIGATKFISSLCILNPSTQYPNGLILAGSNDSSIYGFTLNSSEPVLRLLGHSDTVCSLSAGNFGTIVSGSWDKTARIWSGQECVLSLHGHQQAVWATELFPTQSLVLTGSADHTIRLWQLSGTCERTFTGHEDCVRGLAVVSETKFLSCSNDSTVRLWRTSGETLGIYRSHCDFIYSITLLRDGYDFATCGEDQEVKIWKDGKCVQSVALPCKSLWSVACLPNGDVAVGGSDGKVYVLKRVPKDAFDRATECLIGSVSEIENPIPECPQTVSDNVVEDVSNVKGPEYPVLSRTGTFDGEKVLYYDEKSESMCVYKWDESKKTWLKLHGIDTYGDGPTIESLMSGPMRIEPQEENDVELTVDVDGTIYKLSYRKGENPWIVAQKFVSDHGLFTEHVGQVAEFIIKNTGSDKKSEIKDERKTDYFPMKTYSVYVGVNLEGLNKKLLEFNELVPKTLRLSPSDIDKLMLLAKLPDVVTDEQMALLDSALMWSDEFLFPVLDLLRLAVRAKGMALKVGNQSFINHLLQFLNSTQQPVNRLLLIKIFCNLFGCEAGENAMCNFQAKIFESIKQAFCVTDASIQKAGMALFLNFAVAGLKSMCVNLDAYCVTLFESLELLSDPEAIFRALVAVGTICIYDTMACGYFRSLDIKSALESFEKYRENTKIDDVLYMLLPHFD